MNRQPYEFEIIVENLPPCVLQLRHDKRWQVVKDVLRSSIKERPDNPAEVTPCGNVLACGLRIAKHAKEAYGGMQGMQWTQFCQKIHYKCHRGTHEYSSKNGHHGQQIHTWLYERDSAQDTYHLVPNSPNPDTWRSGSVPVSVPRRPGMDYQGPHMYGIPASDFVSGNLFKSPGSPAYNFSTSIGTTACINPMCEQASTRPAAHGLGCMQPRLDSGPESFASPWSPNTGYDSRHYARHRSTASTSGINRRASDSSPSTETIATSSGLSLGSSRHPTTGFHQSTPKGLGRSYRSTYASSDHRFRAGTSKPSWDMFQETGTDSDSRDSRDNITAMFDPASNDRVVVVMDLDAQAGIRSLRHCLERSMSFRKEDFDVKSLGRDGGRTSTRVVFRKSSLAREALEKFRNKTINGKAVKVEDPLSDNSMAGQPSTESAVGRAAGSGPIIIDGSTRD